MNGFYGLLHAGASDAGTIPGQNPYFSSYRQWLKVTEVPPPAHFFVTIDEHPDSINDGYFINNPSSAVSWGDIPASYHDGGAGLGFADGHSEVHRWLSRQSIPPVRFLYTDPSLDAPGRADYNWLLARTTVHR